MSLDESSALIGMVPTALSKVNYDGQIPAAYEQPINVIQRLQDGIAGADSRHDTATSEFLSRSLNALQRLQNSSTSIDLKA